MDNLDRAILERLTSWDEAPCVSLFLTTHPAGRDGAQDVIQLKNLLRTAEHDLTGHWNSAPKARDLLQRAADLPTDFTFWQHRDEGLAVFIAPDFFAAYRISVPLAPQVVVAHRFRVRPLLPLLEYQRSFFLLAISENQAACYLVDEHSIEKTEVPQLPTNLTEALNYVGADRGSQVHSGMHGVIGKQAAVFHGQGGQPDAAKDAQGAFCVQINRALTAWLGQSDRPLLLAGTEPLAAVYRQKNTYQHLFPETLKGNHEREDLQKLRQDAWRIVQPLLRLDAAKTAARFADRWGTPNVSDDPAKIVTAAIQGRVESLFYDPKAELYGQCDLTGAQLKITGNAADEDLVDLAAVETLRRGGTIQAMTDQDIPTNAPLAALLRY